MEKTLQQRMLSSTVWVSVSHFLSQLLRLSSNLILTRLLVPEMFGVMAIVSVLMTGLAMFSDVGLLQNIVQSKRGEESAYINTAWTIQILRGILICFIAVILSVGLYWAGQSGWLSPETVYGDTELPLILAVVSTTAIISGFNSIHLLVLNRKLIMADLVKIGLLSQIAGLIFMLAWAWYKADIWALVFGTIISALVKMLLSHLIKLGDKCSFQWDRSAASEIIHFGKWIFLTSILGFMINQGDRLILGWLISPELLGIYTIAFFLANALRDVILKLLGSVFYPLLSDLVRNKPDQVENVYYKIRLKIDLVTMPAAGFLFSFGSVIIGLLYDSRYESAGWMLQVLSLSLVSIGFMLADQLFMSYGKPKYGSVSLAIMVITMYVFVPISYVYYGLHGAILAIAINPTLKILVSMLIMKNKFFFKFHREVMMLPLIFIGYFVGEQLKLLFL